MPLEFLVENIIMTKDDSFTIDDIKIDVANYSKANGTSISKTIGDVLDSYITDGIISEDDGKYILCEY